MPFRFRYKITGHQIRTDHCSSFSRVRRNAASSRSGGSPRKCDCAPLHPIRWHQMTLQRLEWEQPFDHSDRLETLGNRPDLWKIKAPTSAAAPAGSHGPLSLSKDQAYKLLKR